MDLQRYFERIGHAGGAEPTLETLTALHVGHTFNIPFENLGCVSLGTLIFYLRRRITTQQRFIAMTMKERGMYMKELPLLTPEAHEPVGQTKIYLAAKIKLPTYSQPSKAYSSSAVGNNFHL